MDASVTWNVTCPLDDPVANAEITAKSLYDTMDPQLNGDLQSVIVYELCGEAVLATPYPPPDSDRRLQLGESEIKFKATVTTKCSACDNQMYQAVDEVLDTVVSDGSLNTSIQNNSNGTLSATIGGVVTTSHSTISNPPTKVPTNVPTNVPTPGTKSAKSAKNSKVKSGEPFTMKPTGIKSAKSDKKSKKY